MNRFFIGAIACAAIIAAAACGGKQSVASRSAAAYRQAIAEGKDVGAGGRVHGGHGQAESAETAAAPHDMSEMDRGSKPAMKDESMPAMHHGSADMKNMPGMQHGTTSTMDHGQMQHGASQPMANMPGMQHGTTSTKNHGQMQHGASQPMVDMPGMQHSTTSTMDHGQMQHGASQPMVDMPGMQHGATSTMDHAQMQHGSSQSMANMPGMSHGAMEGMQHGGTIPPGGLWGPQPGSLAPKAAAPTPRALQPDALDAPAPVSVEESRKSASDDMSGMDHASMPAANTESGSKQVSYTCPMHPEVISATPGTCPKCGMMLVRRGKR